MTLYAVFRDKDAMLLMDSFADRIISDTSAPDSSRSISSTRVLEASGFRDMYLSASSNASRIPLKTQWIAEGQFATMCLIRLGA